MQRSWKVRLLVTGLGGGLLALVTAGQMTRLAYEEAAYDHVSSDGSVEVRRYSPRVVAQTTVSGSEAEVTSEGFRRLAGYIFGGNLGERSVAMTTPVEGARAGERIAMTTPVERVSEDGDWVITFTMPAEHSLDSLPEPDDDRVALRELPATLVAVLRFSGRVDGESRRRRTHELLDLVRRSGYELDGEPSLAQYDPPLGARPVSPKRSSLPDSDRQCLVGLRSSMRGFGSSGCVSTR